MTNINYLCIYMLVLKLEHLTYIKKKEHGDLENI